MAVTFEGKERRMEKIEACLAEYGIESLEAARDLCLSKGIDVEAIVKGTQPIAFENAVWAYTLGVAIALAKGTTNAADASADIGIGLHAFCIPGSVAENRKVGVQKPALYCGYKGKENARNGRRRKPDLPYGTKR